MQTDLFLESLNHISAKHIREADLFSRGQISRKPAMMRLAHAVTTAVLLVGMVGAFLWMNALRQWGSSGRDSDQAPPGPLAGPSAAPPPAATPTPSPSPAPTAAPSPAPSPSPTPSPTPTPSPPPTPESEPETWEEDSATGDDSYTDGQGETEVDSQIRDILQKELERQNEEMERWNEENGIQPEGFSHNPQPTPVSIYVIPFEPQP